MAEEKERETPQFGAGGVAWAFGEGIGGSGPRG